MSAKVSEFPNQSLLYEEAAGWLMRLEERSVSEVEAQELREWIGRSADHKRILLNTLSTWDQMEVMEELADVFPLGEFSNTYNQKKSPKVYAGPAVAAMFAICVIGTTLLWMKHETTPEMLAFETEIGASKTIEMSDGSEVVLNTNTKILTEFNDSKRSIVLEQGEAFFEVEHNPNVPFIVAVNGVEIQAVGTAFGVRVRDGLTDVLVTDGRVRITRDANLPGSSKSSTLFVDKGNKVSIAKEGASTPVLVEPKAIAKMLMWQKQMLAFNGEPLSEVVEEFSRYTNVQISIADKETGEIRVGGFFRSNDLDGLLTSLENNFGISTNSVNQDNIILSSNIQ